MSVEVDYEYIGNISSSVFAQKLKEAVHQELYGGYSSKDEILAVQVEQNETLTVLAIQFKFGYLIAKFFKSRISNDEIMEFKRISLVEHRLLRELCVGDAL